MEYAKKLRVVKKSNYHRSEDVIPDIGASILAKLKNKAKLTGTPYHLCLQLFFQKEFFAPDVIIEICRESDSKRRPFHLYLNEF
jgi:hypothetical protein